MKMEWMAKFSIQRKLFLTLALGALGFILYFGSNLYILTQNESIMTAVVKRHLPMLEATENLGRELSNMKTSAVQSALSANMDGISALSVQNKKVLAAFDTLKNVSGADVKDLGVMLANYNNAYKGTSETLQNLVVGLDKLASAQAKLNTYMSGFGKVEMWAKKLKEDQSEAFSASIESANAGSRRAMYAGFALIIGLIPFAFMFYFITHNVTDGLQTVSARLSEVSQNMLKISAEASTSSAKLASAATQQATSVSESVSSMDEMKAKLNQTVRHSSEALRSSEASFDEASDGKVVIDNLNSATLEIERSYEQLEEVNRVVQMIGEKTAIINDIVFKTQLLSFNASIEAARAGQHGRGFAVVAAEVGKLAEMSGKAAQEIGKLLDQSTKQVAGIVESTKDKVSSANEMSQKCAEVFGRIIERAAQVKSMVTAITDAASEQESGIHQIGQAMDDMSTSASETDKMAHVMSQLSGTLRNHSESLAVALESLDKLVHGDHSVTTSEPTDYDSMTGPEFTSRMSA